jgi:hypothetical protein
VPGWHNLLRFAARGEALGLEERSSSFRGEALGLEERSSSFRGEALGFEERSSSKLVNETVRENHTR